MPTSNYDCVQLQQARLLADYQKVGIRWLSSRQGAILADEMGLGKTIQAICAADEIQANHILVVTKKSLIHQWIKEIEGWSYRPSIGVLKTKGVIPDTRWLVTNYEVLTRRGDIPPPDLLIVDEAHAIKSRRARRTRAVWAMAGDADYVWLLTGTPMVNRPDELWSLLHCLYPKRYRSYWKWVEKWCVTRYNGYGVEIHGLRPDRLEEWQKTLEGVMLRRTREFLCLPDLTADIVRVKLLPRQAQMYRQMRDTLVATLHDEKVLTAPTVLAQLMRLRQIACSPHLVGMAAASAKEEWIKEVLLDYLDDYKVLVFTSFRQWIPRLVELLWYGQPVKVTGGQQPSQVEEAVRRFQEDPNCRVLVGTIGATGEGLNLQAADVVVFLDLPWTPALALQPTDLSWCNPAAFPMSSRHGVYKRLR